MQLVRVDGERERADRGLPVPRMHLHEAHAAAAAEMYALGALDQRQRYKQLVSAASPPPLAGASRNDNTPGNGHRGSCGEGGVSSGRVCL